MKNQPSINPRERRAMLDSQYVSIINQEDIGDAPVEQIRKLVTNLIALNFCGSKKNLGSGYAGKSRKLLDKFGEKFENDELIKMRFFEIIASCSNKWIEGLKNLGIKQINVGAQYDNIGLDMIIKESNEIKNLDDTIFNSFLQNRNWELSYNQMCNAFNFATTQLGILNVDRLPIYKRKEKVKSIQKVEDSQFRESEIILEFGSILTLSNLDPDDIEKGDYFELTYSDPQFTRDLEKTLCGSTGERKKNWVSQEYIDNKDSDKTKSVVIEK